MPRQRPEKAQDGGRTCQPVSGSPEDTKPASGLPSVSTGHAIVSEAKQPMADPRTVAMDALLAVAGDAASPAAARAQAARTLLELVGAIGPGRVSPAASRPVSEMTLADIDAEIRRLEQGDAAE